MALDGYIEQDPRGIITAWRAESETLFGWSERDTIGMRSHRLISARTRDRHDRALQILINAPERPIQRLALTALHQDGGEFRADFTISIAGRGALRVVAVVRGVTPDARAENAFRQSERFIEQ
jgi:PAS domain S-box-containing protein